MLSHILVLMFTSVQLRAKTLYNYMNTFEIKLNVRFYLFVFLIWTMLMLQEFHKNIYSGGNRCLTPR